MTTRSPDYRALSKFRAALRRFLRRSEDAARRAGITPAQYSLLLAIKGHPADVPPSVGELAGVLQLRPNSVVELVDRAAAAGLVERKPDPSDARRQRLVLTANGEAKLDSLSHLQQDELSRFRLEVVEHLGAIE
jgi:DNA-binding MarR family transcriptional regulator